MKPLILASSALILAAPVQVPPRIDYDSLMTDREILEIVPRLKVEDLRADDMEIMFVENGQ